MPFYVSGSALSDKKLPARMIIEFVPSDTILEGKNIHHTVLYYSTGKLAPKKIIVVVPLEQVRKEGSRVSFHCGSE